LGGGLSGKIMENGLQPGQTYGVNGQVQGKAPAANQTYNPMDSVYFRKPGRLLETQPIQDYNMSNSIDGTNLDAMKRRFG
jgi:hypothetical protein